MRFRKYIKRYNIRKLLQQIKLRRLLRAWRRQPKRKRALLAALMATVVVIVAGAVYKTHMESIDPTAYSPLLSVIAKGESNGNYNAYYGNAGNATIRFTEMSLEEVLRWQGEYVNQGQPSSAVGRYQIIRPTLNGLVREHKLDPKARFDKTMQDKLAIMLLERRGAKQYVKKKISRDQFAARLAQEWAALPRITGEHPQQSYYAGDGINVARVSIEDIYRAIAKIDEMR